MLRMANSSVLYKFGVFIALIPIFFVAVSLTLRIGLIVRFRVDCLYLFSAIEFIQGVFNILFLTIAFRRMRAEVNFSFEFTLDSPIDLLFLTVSGELFGLKCLYFV
jgi:hypothetical protein